MSNRVIDALRRGGHEAYWVGGSVRDELLGRPAQDRDVATSARPEEVKAIFPDAHSIAHQKKQEFGVTRVPEGAGHVHVATYRRDHGYADGRRPIKVSFTDDVTEDVQRRDFTINALLRGPTPDELIDHVGGLRDLRSRLVRAIGDPLRRFQEDRLRMLRAVRFAASLQFEIEPGTFAAIQALAPGIRAVAAERTRDELERILTEGGARRGFELLAASGLLEPLLPEVAALRGVEQPPEFHPEGDVWEHTLRVVDGLREPSGPLAWAALLHDIGKPDTFRRADRIRFHGHAERGVELAAAICSRLRFSNADRRRVLELVGNHMKFMNLARMRPAKVQRFVRQPHFEEHLELHRLDCLASNGRLENHAFASERFEEAMREEPRVRLLTGEDLKLAGYEPGPLFGAILKQVEEGQLEGRFADREQALAFVRERFPLKAA